jgi:hypothetical protein
VDCASEGLLPELTNEIKGYNCILLSINPGWRTSPTFDYFESIVTRK